MAQGRRPTNRDSAGAGAARAGVAGPRRRSPPTVREALKRTHDHLAGRGLRSPREDAEAIVARALRRDRVFLFAHPEAVLSEVEDREIARWTRLRGQHFPLQYMRGEQEFLGRVFEIDRSTLIPRPETEIVVEAALRELAGAPPSPRALDIGTGSGCIAVSLACERADLSVVAVDVSPPALSVARRNARRLGCADRVRFFSGDLMTALRRLPSFDLVVSNPPYVAWEDRPRVDRSVALYEPPAAVFAGEGGLEFYGGLLRQAPGLLKPGGRLVVELGYDLLDAVSSLAGRLGWRRVSTAEDLAGVVRCAVFEASGASAAGGGVRTREEGETA